MGTAQKLAGLVAIALAGYISGHCAGDDSRVVKEAEARADTLKQQVEMMNSQIRDMLLIDVMRVDSIKKLSVTLESHKQVEKKLAVATEKIKQDIRQQLNDSAFKVVEPLIMNYEARLEAMAIQNRTLQEIVSVQGNQIVARDTIIDALRRVNKDLEREVGRLNKDLKHVSRHATAWKVVAAGAAVTGYLVGSHLIQR